MNKWLELVEIFQESILQLAAQENGENHLEGRDYFFIFFCMPNQPGQFYQGIEKGLE